VSEPTFDPDAFLADEAPFDPDAFLADSPAEPVAPEAITNDELALRTRGPTVPLGNGQSVLRSSFTTEAAPADGPAFTSDGTRVLPSLLNANAGTVDPDVVDETAVRNAKLRRAFELAKSKDGPALGRAVEISRAFNVPVRQVLPNLPEFERAAEAAKFDPDAFYRDNKLLADVMVDSPETMAAVVVDPNVGPLVQAFRKVQDLGLPSALSTAFNYGPGLMVQAPAMLAESTKRLWDLANGVDVAAADKQAASDAAAATSKQRNAKQTKFDSPEAKAIREAGDVERTALTLQRRYREARAQSDMANAASDLAMAEAKDELGLGDGGQAAAEAGRRVQDARAASRPLLLGEGDALGFVGDNLQALVSTFDTLVGSAKGMGAGGAVGALVGGAVGGVGTKTPAGVVAGAKEGAKLGAEKGRTIGGVLSAFRAEQGGKYLDLRDAVTDDGAKLSKLEALGGSVTYGLVAAYLENLGTQAQFAPAADALKGQVRKLLLGDPLFRSKVAGLARAWVNGAGTEAVTEGLQSTADQVIVYAAKSLKDERLQRGPMFNPEQSLQEAQGGLFGGAVVTGATSLSTVALEAINTDTAAVTSPRQVAVIASLAEQQPVRGAPAEFAEVVRRATTEAGAPVREFWVEASALQRLNQEAGRNDEQLAMELGEAAGPEAVQAYQAAVAEGGRFPVPLEQVLTTWAASPMGQALLEHTATSETAPTAAQLTGEKAALDAIRQHALQMAEKALEESADEDGFDDALDTMRRDIIDAGRSGREARDAVQVVRAFYATAKADNPSLTWKKVLETAGLLQFAEGDDGDTKVRVKAVDAATDLRNLLDFGGPNETPLSIEQKAELLFRDDVSGLRTAEGWELAKKPEGFMVAQVTTPDAKAVNDNPQGSHDATNALLARMGAVVAKHDATAARAGTNFWLHVKDQAALDALMADLRAAMPAGMTAHGALASTREQAGRNLDKVVDEARTSGVVPPRGKTAYTGPLGNLAEGVQLPATPLGNEHLAAVDAEGKYESRERFGTRAFLDDVVPGLLSRLGFLKSKAAKFVASMDMRGLRDVNIEAGKRAGDVLLTFFGDQLVAMGGHAFAAAHMSGDEYAMKSDSKEALIEMLSDLRDELESTTVVVKAWHTPVQSLADVEKVAGQIGTKTEGVLVVNGTEMPFTGAAALVSMVESLPGGSVDGVVRISAQSLSPARFRFGLGEGTYGQADRDLNRRKQLEKQTGEGGVEAGDVGGARNTGTPGDDLRERRSSLEQRRARAQYRGAPAASPFVDAAEGEAAQDGGGDFAGSEGDGRTAVRVALADPEAIASLASAIGRMKTLVPEQQARVARYKAFLAYVEGSAPRPKSAAGEAAGLKRTEQLDMLKRFGIDDPEGTFTEQRQLGGIDEGLRRAKKKKTGTANPNQAEETRLKLLRGEKLFYQDQVVKPLAEVEAEAAKAGVKLDVSNGAVIEVSRIVVPEGERGKGIGTKVMKQIVEFADSVGKAVALSPSVDFGGSSVKRLEAFYRRFGFVPNKGKSKDFATKASMVRPARERLFQSDVTTPAVSPHKLSDGRSIIVEPGAEGAASRVWLVDVPVLRDILQRNEVELSKAGDDELVATLKRTNAAIFAAFDEGNLTKAAAIAASDERWDASFTLYSSPDIDPTKIGNPFQHLHGAFTATKEEIQTGDFNVDFDASSGQATGLDTNERRSAWESLSDDNRQTVQVALDEYEAATGRMQQDEANMRSSPRGYFERPPPGAEGVARVMKVFLNKKADASTVFHESAHGFLEMLGNLAEAEGAGARTKQQWADTLKWLGVSSRAEVKRDQHEKFARAFEAFLREGRAPAKGLWGTFNRAKAWLTRIYKQVAQLDVELDDDIRRIFSRLLATDEEIARANGKRGASPWETAEEAGMSPEAWQEYQDADKEALAFATREAQARFTREALEDAERDFAEQLAAARKDAEAEYEALPARKAARYLDGQAKDLLDAGLAMAPVVLDRSAVESAVGATGVRKFRTRKQGGAQPDEVATLVGYPTGKDMLQAIASLPPAVKWVEQRAQALAEERDAAGAAELARLRKDVESGVQAYVEARLAREWTELGRRAEPGSDVSELGRQVALEMLRQASRLIVERQRVGTLSPAKVLGRERAAAVKVRNAARTGNMDAARDWFREQTLQAYTHGATLDAIKERDRFEKMASGLTETAARARLGKASPSLRDAVDYLLGVFGLGAETELTGETLQAAAAVLEESGGVPGDWLEALQVPELQGSGDWRNLSVANLRHLDAALRQLLAEARFRNEVMVGERMADIEATEAAALAEIESTLPALRAPGSSTSDSTVDVAMSFLSASDGYLTNPVDLIRDLTGDNIDSTLFKAIIDPMRRARDKKVDLLKKSVQPITDAIEAMPEELKNRLSDAVDGNRLFPNHIEELQPPRMVHELLVLALNVGNPGNLQRLTDGRRITVEEVARAIDTLPDAALRWVQTVWDANESLKGEAFDLEERVTGIRPQGVERQPFRLPSGRVLEGGYVPAVYDVRASLLGQKQQDEKLAAAFDPHFVRAGTSHNHLKSRSKEVTEHAISLDMHVVYRHLSQVAHDIAFRETIMSVGRLVLRPAMQKAFNKYLGDKKTRGIWRWLTDVGSNTGADVTVADKLMSFARSEGSRILLGWKPSTAFGDLANPFAAVASTPLKMKFLAMGIRDFGRAPFAAREAALAASPWLRTMVDNTKQQFDLQVKKILKKDLPAPLRWYRDHAFWFMETVAVATTTPTWMGAVKQALAEGRTQEESVRFADDVLSQAWPSHSPVDQAAILRDKGVGGRLTVFYGYLSVAYRAQRRIIRPLFEREFLDATIGPQVKTVAGVSVRLLGFLTAYAALGELLMGRGPEEGDEDEEEPNNPLLRWRNWYLRKLATAPVQALPFVDWARAIDAAVLGKRAPSARGSPVATLTELITKDIGTALNGDKPALDRVLAVLKLALEAKGLSPGPVSTQGKYLLDVTLGDLPVEDPLDVTSGLMYGQRKNQPANIFRPLVQ